jgi:hypothetical protein
MTNGPGELTNIQLARARSTLRQKVDALLRGRGLEVRERASGLTISSPRDPDQGCLHIAYATGEVSWKRTTWTFLGPLQGYERNDDPDREPAVDAAKIIATLTGRIPPEPPL